MASEIDYDPTLNLGAGYVTITGAGQPGGLKPPHHQTLLHFLFWALYTFDGREIMRKNLPAPGDTWVTPAQEQVLRDKMAEFGIVDPALANAILDSHIAAELWVRAYKAGPTQDVERAKQEKIYLQNMAFITWCLWEAAKGHEFSMGW